MKKQETMEGFYDDRGIIPQAGSRFNVFENEAYCSYHHVYNRRDFYKVSLFLGAGKLSWHHQDVHIDRPAMFFSNPQTPFAWVPLSAAQPGYFCMFSKDFLSEQYRNDSLQQLPLFTPGINPVFFPDEAQVEYIADIYKRMLHEIGSDYTHKYDLLRHYLCLLIHEALKMSPAAAGAPQKSAAERITTRFFELLERQFPIDAPERILKMKAAGDYAQALSMHVNHLNHAVREVTGKSTSVHIADRVLAEARALLKHTDWPVSEIAYSLGFEYPNYFNSFYKKKTGDSPRRSRAGII